MWFAAFLRRRKALSVKGTYFKKSSLGGATIHAYIHTNFSLRRQMAPLQSIKFQTANYVADLKALGVTNTLRKYADDTTLLVPELCDVSIEDELENIIPWSHANELQLNYLIT